MAESVQVDPELLAEVARHLQQVAHLVDEARDLVGGLDHGDAFQSAQPEAAWSQLQQAARRACEQVSVALSTASSCLDEGTALLRQTDLDLRSALDGFLTGAAS
jgi:hypothetical protein